nr:tol-pal system protein YbgF [Oceanicola sp. S124]
MLLAAPLSQPAVAQDQAATLADIRQQLTVLNVEIQGLKRELSTTGAPSQLATGGSQLDRVNAIEAEMRRLISHTEELEHRIDRVVSDGTNRISDLEFRLVELEGGDLSKLGETSTLGGGTLPQQSGGLTSAAPLPSAPVEGGSAPQLAISEQADFQAAADKLAQSDFTGALTAYETFKATYPGSPLSPAADLGRGRALEGQGDVKTAARAYLDAFSAAPKGDTAPESLYRLGVLLGKLGQQSESCVTLGEVGNRFPASDWASQAAQARIGQGCS